MKDPVALEKLAKIDTERRRAAEIIRELLGLSKSRPIRAIDTDLRPVVTAAVDQVRRKRKKGVKVEMEGGDAPVRATVDPLQIQEVVVNLVKNALDATAAGSVRIRVEDRPDAHAIIVSDTGTGPAWPRRSFPNFSSRSSRRNRTAKASASASSCRGISSWDTAARSRSPPCRDEVPRSRSSSPGGIFREDPRRR